MEISNIDLNLLFTLHTFVETGSISRTADELNRSQPAISERLHRLERDLGVDLLQQVGRTLELTPAGRLVVEQSRPLLKGLTNIVDTARSAEKGITGQLRIGSLTTITVNLLAPLIKDFTDTHDGLRIQFEYEVGATQLEKLRSGTIDMVFSVGEPPAETDLRIDVIREVRPVLVAPEGVEVDPETGERAFLRDVDFVAFGQWEDPFFGAVWNYMQRYGLDSNVVLQVPHIQTIKKFVQLGVGVSILPAYTVEEPGLATWELENMQFRHPLWMAARETSTEIPAISALWDEVREAIAEG